MVSQLWFECAFQMIHIYDEWWSGMIIMNSGIEFKHGRGLLKSAKGIYVFERCESLADFFMCKCHPIKLRANLLLSFAVVSHQNLG